MKPKDFQQAAVDYIVERFKDKNCHRFLCADEVGLGKTIIAKGVIDHMLKQNNGRLRVFYICSSQYLAIRNLPKLHMQLENYAISRLTEVIVNKELTVKKKGLQILPLSIKTSVDLRSRGGIVFERAILYHLLKHYEPLKGRRFSTYKRILSMNIEGWEPAVERIKENVFFDESIARTFISKLKHNKEVNELLFDCFNGWSDDYLSLIGELRSMLAVATLKSLKPDLVILDEFQRFADILKKSEDDAASQLITTLFRNESGKMLLLSATPYKMFTIREEHLENNSHYAEFDFLMKFLMKEEYAVFEKDWKAYSDAIFSLNQDPLHEIASLKDRIEKRLLRYVCRTERTIAYTNEVSQVKPVPVKLPFCKTDISNFVITDNITKRIQEEPGFEDLYSPLEYCKTSPYPLSFMEHYKFKKDLRELQNSKPLSILPFITENKQAFLSYEYINSYKDQPFPNAKLQWLAEQITKKGTSLLWIPPSIPYYRLEGAYKDTEESGFSKMMIFGKFAIEPRMISVMASYKAECLTTGNKAYQPKGEKRIRKYFTSDGESIDEQEYEDSFEAKKFARSPRRRLYFRNDDSSYSLLCFYYPSIFLSEKVAENLKLDLNQSLKSVKKTISKQINTALEGIERFASNQKGSTQSRWYFFAMLYLDYQYKRNFMEYCLKGYRKNNPSIGQVHYRANKIFDYAGIILEKGPSELAKELSLGTVPRNLVSVMTIIALGSPSTLLFQTFCQYKSKDVLRTPSIMDSLSWNAAFNLAEGFRSFYNQPEHIATIDIHSHEDKDYLLSMLEYNLSGCLKSVIDECFYTYTDGVITWDVPGNSSIESFAEFFQKIISLRTSTLEIDVFETKTSKIRRAAMRTHYAIPFTDQQETEQTMTRKGEVQDSFNSPFRPFILSTTSIGQEGLDFHKYCRRIVHWSLPSNAIDIEQREGRIDRYKSYSIRLNLVNRFRDSLNQFSLSKPVWVELFQMAENDIPLRNNKCEIIPYWYVPIIKFPIERLVPIFPFSKDQQKLDQLLRTLAIYRLSLGQPNQEDLIKYFLNNFTEDELNLIKGKMIINLSPVAQNGGGKSYRYNRLIKP